jgi:LmbE family N-acetylglucosaminyl deacetylase
MSLYPMATDGYSRLLGIFAHPDDEVFCAGGTLARWAAAGGETMVISATRGEAGQIQDARTATRRSLGSAREQELRAACARLGVRQVECLDYRDGALSAVDETALARDLARRIRDFAPDVVITFGPDGAYGHPDHIAIGAATTRACELIARAGGRAPHLYYSAFPRQRRLLCQRLAHWLTDRGSRFRGSDTFVRALTLLADEATLLGYADDAVQTQWFPAGFSIVEQDERGANLYLIISGHAEVLQEDAGGTPQPSGRLGPGQFFGERALAHQRPQDASVVASDTVTCLVLSPQPPTAFAGRGAEAQLGGASLVTTADDERARAELLCVEMSSCIESKLAALAAHRTQFAIEPAMFPSSLLQELLGSEYFVRVAVPAWRATAVPA